MKYFASKESSVLLVALIVGCSAAEPPTSTSTRPTPTEAHVADVEVQETPEPPTVDRLHVEWTVDEQFTSDELDAILVAGEDWATVTEGRVGLTFKVAAVEVGTPWTIARTDIPNANGRTSIFDTGTFIEIDANNFENTTCVGQVWYVAAHELGHSLGILTHGPTGVMKTGAGAANCAVTFTHSDIDLFNAANPN